MNFSELINLFEVYGRKLLSQRGTLRLMTVTFFIVAGRIG